MKEGIATSSEGWLDNWQKDLTTELRDSAARAASVGWRIGSPGKAQMLRRGAPSCNAVALDAALSLVVASPHCLLARTDPAVKCCCS